MYTYVTYTYKYTKVIYTCIYSEFSTRVHSAHAVFVGIHVYIEYMYMYI